MSYLLHDSGIEAAPELAFTARLTSGVGSASRPHTLTITCCRPWSSPRLLDLPTEKDYITYSVIYSSRCYIVYEF